MSSVSTSAFSPFSAPALPGHPRFGAAQASDWRQYHSERPKAPPAQKGTVNGRGKKLNGLQRLADRMIHWYQKNEFIHDKLYRFVGLKCGYKAKGWSPLSCSEYTRKAIQEKGFLKGGTLGFFRIANCNPLTLLIKPLQKLFVNVV